ncbi:MAG: hypothetical protein P8129_20155 [Anaerolineae bacterium]
MSLVFTYPLPLHLATAVEDWRDALLNVWITAWDTHQILLDPLHLFDANIFHPYPLTLAYSELVLGNALLALPLTLVSGNPVLGYNFALLLSFLLSGLGTYLLVLKLTRSHGAGIVAGIIFAFSSYRMTNLAQVQLITTQWIPFALLSLYQLMRRPQRRHVATFVLFFSLQVLSCFYYGLLLGLTVVGLVVWQWASERSTRQWGTVLRLAVAGGGIAILVLPFVLPYVRVNQALGLERTLADSEPFSANLSQYLLVPPNSVLHGLWLPIDDEPMPGGYPIDALFPGLMALGLGAWGLIRGGGRRAGRQRWFFALLLLAALVLSFGPRLYVAAGQPAGLAVTLPYAWLYRLVPGAKALRAPVRFDLLVMLALAVLAGYGVATLRRRPVLIGAVALLAALELLVWPGAGAERVPLRAEVPAVYHWLADQPPGPVLELPLISEGAGPPLEYQYMSTFHWQTTPDGYSGFFPPTHGRFVDTVAPFPAERSLRLLQALDVGYVIIHSDRYPAARWQEMERALAGSEDVHLVKGFGADQVYALRPRTFDPASMTVRLYAPARAAAGRAYTAYLIAINHGQDSYAVAPTDLLRLTADWEGAGLEAESAEARLPLLVLPGGAAVLPLALAAPQAPGSYHLSLSAGDGPLGAWSGEAPVEVGGEGDPSFPVPARLADWSVASQAEAGQPLEVNLKWLALDYIETSYSVYVKLLRDGQQVAGWDGPPGSGQAPTDRWQPGQVIDDVVTLEVPPDASPGEYTVEVGMYRYTDLARALTLNEEGVPVERVVLGTVQVQN